MSVYEELCDKIALQQKGHAGTDVFAVGEQLKDICRGNDHFAEIVLTDLENKDMTLEKAAQKIRDFAKKNKTGNFGFCGPADADRILRKFYGLPAEAAPVQDRPKKVDLLDFI
jgi:hypothetical protein